MSLKKPNWTKWGAIDQAELWQAVALACDVAPEELVLTNPDDREKGPVFLPNVGHDEVPGFDHKLEIAQRQVGERLASLRFYDGCEGRPRCFSVVYLADFALWALGEVWELPSGFLSLEVVRRGHVDWREWTHRPHAELWEVVAVSLGIIPDSLIFLGDEFDPQSPAQGIPEQFRKRLVIAETHVGGDLKAAKIVEKKRRKYFSTVRLADFAAWFIGLDPPLQPPLPSEFPKPAPQQERPHVGNTWPWGPYETKLLGHLAAAVQKFWTGYDPERPQTAPTNKKVEEWLKARGVAERVAEIMVQIIRADDAPRGPRPSS